MKPTRFHITLLGTLSLLFLLIASCSKKTIHPGFESNEYIQGFRTHFLNREVKVYHTTLGDVRYIDTRDSLEWFLSKEQLNNVLAYARTDVPPYYEYYLLVNPSKRKLDLNGFDLVHDTVVRGRRVMFLGRGLGEDRFPPSDFEQITSSLQGGKGYPEEIDPITDVVQQFSKSANFLKAYHDIAAYPVQDDLERDYQQQMELTYLCMLGDNPYYQQVLSERENRYPLRADDIETLGGKGLIGEKEVIRELLTQTKEQRVVMFSENHFMPQHRVLLNVLLPDLWDQGYRYLALEALYQDSLLNTGKQPDLETGFYTREQHFYRLLRSARKLGFEFVSYEAEAGDRELLQAQNLYRKTIGKDPDARVVVLAGLAHIYEKEGGSRTRMAQHFATLYGIDPLTISQTDLAHYRHQMSSGLVLIASDSLENSRWKRVDLHVVNNLNWGYSPGDFIYANTLEKPVQLALYNAEGWLSDYGYLGDTPEFSALVLPGESFSVNLPEGSYQLLVFDRNGDVLENKPARVLKGQE